MNKANIAIVLGGLLLLVGSVFGTYYLTKQSISTADTPVLPISKSETNSSTNSTATKSISENTNISNTVADNKPITLVLQPGYNLVTIPYILSPNDGSTVFVGLQSKEAYTLDKQSWVSLFSSGTLTPGKAVWIKSEKGEVYDLPVSGKAVDDTKPFTIRLESGWNAVGNPFGSDILWNPIVKTSKGSTTLQKAIDAKIVSTSNSSDPVGNKYTEIKPGDTLRKYQGLLVQVAGAGIDLIIDPTTAIVK